MGGSTERILVGHFLTREQAAGRARIRPDELSHRPDLLRIGGTHLEEVYFGFQFDRRGIRRDLGRVVQHLLASYDDVTIADWLARPNEHLGAVTPLRWIAMGHDMHHIAEAADTDGPHRSAA